MKIKNLFITFVYCFYLIIIIIIIIFSIIIEVKSILFVDFFKWNKNKRKKNNLYKIILIYKQKIILK